MKRILIREKKVSLQKRKQKFMNIYLEISHKLLASKQASKQV